MTINYRRARGYLERFDFRGLFVEELGWAKATGRTIPLTAEGANFRLSPLATMGGMTVYACEPAGSKDGLPPKKVRQRIEKDVLKLAHEHIIIFMNAEHSQATWLWVKREVAGAAKAREHTYSMGQPGDSLLQKLAGIAFHIEDLDADGQASVLEVTGKVAKAFDVERITKRFYDQFKDEHAAFLKLIKGIDTTDDRAWYTSVMLNRLMFIYFIQKKSFLDDDPNYLRHKLEATKKRGANRYYRDFLTVLFFEGFAHETKERPDPVQQLLGDVPYLNGGLFQPHSIETQYGDAIQIPDAVFSHLFDFFDAYTWHLDDRPLQADNEINPDVLGYIFEKYINQKQMGAYYTKEDITGYICRNTILPFLFDKLGTLRYQAVHPLPMADIERYIYPAVKQADPLPTETEREQAARRERLAQIRADFKAGKIESVNDLITYNLDIEQYTRDFLEGLNDPLTLRAFYFECLLKLTVLDPTVGSGAFLFAAMNILEPLYVICLEKMRRWAGSKFPDFIDELARMDDQASRRYFIFKSIIVNNLYGVDIMEEATEICKLRLFLKLVAQIDDRNRIEPLPDIDFNIRAGNTLVGYASLEHIEKAGNFFTLMLAPKVRAADAALGAFRDLQTAKGISANVLAEAKADIREKLNEIERELNEALRGEYGSTRLDKFVKSHQPFHWYVEFNQIMQNGGFDVVVGNPPYVEYSKVTKDYQLRGYSTLDCGNLYAYILERSLILLQRYGRLGMIVPMSVVATHRMTSVRDLILKQTNSLHVSNYSGDAHPSILFEGVKMRLSILLAQHTEIHDNLADVFTTNFQRWYSEARPSLFSGIQYVKAPPGTLLTGLIPKLGSGTGLQVLQKLFAQRQSIGDRVISDSEHSIYSHRIVAHFVKCMDFIPYFRNDRDGVKRSEDYKVFSFKSQVEALVASAILNSSLFYFFYLTYSDAYHCGRELILSFPCDLLSIESGLAVELRRLNRRLMDDLKRNSVRRKILYHGTGWIEYDEFYPRHSKNVVDDIDRILGRHYGLSTNEIDFIINFDIKFRIGRDGVESE